jgi:large subunit ribosomal protein L29
MKQEVRELKESSGDELARLLDEAKSGLYDLRVNAKTGQTEKTADIRKAKKRIARILTEINMRKKDRKPQAQPVEA